MADTNRPVCPWCGKPLHEVGVDYQYVIQQVDDDGRVVPKAIVTSDLDVCDVVCLECGERLDPDMFNWPS